MFLKVLWTIIKLPVTLATGIYKLLKRKKKKRTLRDFPGIYIVTNHPDTIKIGRSKHVLRRLRQYRGYQHDGGDIPRLLLIKCK